MARTDRSITLTLNKLVGGEYVRLYRPLIIRMRLQNSLALIAATILHAITLLTLFAVPELGRNTHALSYPVRARVVTVKLLQTGRPPTAPLTVPIPAKFASPIPAPLPSLAEEGSTDRVEKNDTDIKKKYFRPDELDMRPVVLTPLDLGASNMSPTQDGDAIVHFFINEGGSVDRLEIEESTLPEAMLEQLHLQRELLYFSPGRKDGLDVKSMITYKIHLAREPVSILNGSATQ